MDGHLQLLLTQLAPDLLSLSKYINISIYIYMDGSPPAFIAAARSRPPPPPLPSLSLSIYSINIFI